MPLETGSTISAFDPDWPKSGDPVSRGDDHLRLIKSVLQTQFPGAGGHGFAKPITATEDQINQAAFPSGTTLPFYNTNVPPFWTRITGLADKALRVADAGGVIGGAHSFVAGCNVVASHDHPFTAAGATDNNTADHVHQYLTGNSSIISPGTSGSIYVLKDPYWSTTGVESAHHSHTFSITGTTSTNTGTIWKPYYADVVLGSKN